MTKRAKTKKESSPGNAKPRSIPKKALPATASQPTTVTRSEAVKDQGLHRAKVFHRWLQSLRGEAHRLRRPLHPYTPSKTGMLTGGLWLLLFAFMFLQGTQVHILVVLFTTGIFSMLGYCLHYVALYCWIRIRTMLWPQVLLIEQDRPVRYTRIRRADAAAPHAAQWSSGALYIAVRGEGCHQLPPMDPSLVETPVSLLRTNPAKIGSGWHWLTREFVWASSPISQGRTTVDSSSNGRNGSAPSETGQGMMLSQFLLDVGEMSFSVDDQLTPRVFWAQLNEQYSQRAWSGDRVLGVAKQLQKSVMWMVVALAAALAIFALVGVGGAEQPVSSGIVEGAAP